MSDLIFRRETMTTRLVPNGTGLVDIRIDREDAKLGYIMVEDWEGKTHRIVIRGNEGDVMQLPVPKIKLKPSG
jgi:hypothetical protein